VTCTQTKAPRKEKKREGWGKKKLNSDHIREKLECPILKNRRVKGSKTAISQSKERNSVGAAGLQLRGLGRRG
jgi:hypothetical protein